MNHRRGNAGKKACQILALVIGVICNHSDPTAVHRDSRRKAGKTGALKLSHLQHDVQFLLEAVEEGRKGPRTLSTFVISCILLAKDLEEIKQTVAQSDPSVYIKHKRSEREHTHRVV